MPLSHSATTGAFDKHLSPQDERQYDRIWEDPSCSCAQTMAMTRAVEKYQIIWGRSVQANISFHINGCHGDTYKDLAMIEQLTLLKEAAEVKEIATHPLSSQITHPMGSHKTAHFLSLFWACPQKIHGRSRHVRLMLSFHVILRVLPNTARPFLHSCPDPHGVFSSKRTLEFSGFSLSHHLLGEHTCAVTFYHLQPPSFKPSGRRRLGIIHFNPLLPTDRRQTLWGLAHTSVF